MSGFDYFIKNDFKNSSKYRGVGIDIRSDGGYIVAPPSIREGKPYKIINNTKPLDIPASLIQFLIVGKDAVMERVVQKKVAKECTPKNDYRYDLSEEVATNVLQKLDDKYLHNYNDWLVATTAMKCHELYKIWDEWCKKSPKYNQAKNQDHWNHNRGIIDINYLIWDLRKKGEKMEFIKRYKHYEPITKDVQGMTRVNFNSKYISDGFTYEHFQNYETFIVQGCTGTGKTTAVANHVEKYSTPETKFLSITTRQSLSDQHAKSFEKMGMENYQDIKTDLYDASSLTICLNSLVKIDALGDSELKNYIVYIDEIASFLEFTENSTLDSVLKRVLIVLMRIVKNAGKIIVSDALINDNVFEFLKHRDLNSTIFIKNSFQKFKDVPAVRVRDEANVFNKLLDRCANNEPFLFGSDSCDVITKFFHRCKDANPDQSDKFILITADTNVRVKDASKEWQGKYVF